MKQYSAIPILEAGIQRELQANTLIAEKAFKRYQELMDRVKEDTTLAQEKEQSTESTDIHAS